jgi:hypothetical protein
LEYYNSSSTEHGKRKEKTNKYWKDQNFQPFYPTQLQVDKFKKKTELTFFPEFSLLLQISEDNYRKNILENE